MISWIGIRICVLCDSDIFYWRKEQGWADLPNTLNMVIGCVEFFLGSFEKSFDPKNGLIFKIKKWMDGWIDGDRVHRWGHKMQGVNWLLNNTHQTKMRTFSKGNV